MLLPRAAALSAALALVLTGCAADPQPVVRSVPFGSHQVAYAKGTLRPTGDQQALDQQVRDFYGKWKAAFVTAKCGSQQVVSPDADHPYVGEAQGYGLVIAATMGDRELFDGILKYVEAHPSVNNPDLLAAEQDKNCKSVNGSDSATDGDLDIAYGLLMADRQWGATRPVCCPTSSRTASQSRARCWRTSTTATTTGTPCATRGASAPTR